MRKLSFRLLAVVLALPIALALGELALRLLPLEPQTFRSTALETPHAALWQNPDLRGRPYQPGRHPGVFRVLMLGDSFTWGVGVHAEDTYPRKLERRLNELGSAVEFEVVSWSRPGWNTDRAWQAVRYRLGGMWPDLVIVGFCLNDAEPSNQEELTRLQQGLEARRPQGPVGGRLYELSRVSRQLWTAIENLRVKRALRAYYRGLYAGQPGWQRCQRALWALRWFTRERSIPMLLVIWPIFDSPLDHRYAYRDLHRIVAEKSAELEVPTLDLLSRFEGMDARRLALVPFTDAHPNELAHRIAADAILEHLLESGSIPAGN